MKMNLARAAAAAAALGIAGLAQAVPIYVDFTGTITASSDGVGIGGAVSGSFNFETDRLALAPHHPGAPYTFRERPLAGATEPLALLNLGGPDIEFPRHGNSYNLLSFVDNCLNGVCDTPYAENFNFLSWGETPYELGYTGLRQLEYFYVISYAETPIPDAPYWQPFDYFDGATAQPIDVVSLPLYNMVGLYAQTTDDCVLGNCTRLSDRVVEFAVGAADRGIGSRPTSVPEPGTLGLLGVALAGMFFLRRRTISASIR